MKEKVDTGMFPAISPTTAGVAFALVAVVVWSGNFIVGRGLATTVPPFTLAFLRWGGAFVMLLPFVWRPIWTQRVLVKKHLVFLTVTAAIGVSYFNTAIYFAARTTPALNLSFIAISAPLFTLVLARILFQESLSRKQMLGVALVLVGVVCLISKGDMAVLQQLAFGKGDLLMLSSAVTFSIYTLLLRRVPPELSGFAFLGITFGIGSAILLPFCVWEQMSMVESIPWTPTLVGIFVYLSAGPSILSFYAWGQSIKRLGASKSSILYYSLPLFCGIEAVVFLDEPVLWVHLYSGLLIVGGMVIATLTSARK